MQFDKAKIQKAKEKLGERTPYLIAEILNLQGFDEHTMKALCPVHQEDTPSFIYNPKMMNFHCFGCGCNVDILDAYVLSGRTFSESVEELFNETNTLCSFGERGVRTRREYRYPTEVPKGPRDIVDAYFATRKISAKTLDHCDVREDTHGNAVFNYYDTNDVLTMVKYRPAHKLQQGEAKNWCQANADTAPLLFNMNRINIDQPLLITEGESDCLAAIEAGFLNAVSIPLGAQNYHWIEHNLEWLDQFSEIIICSDNDDPGMEMRKTVCPRLGSWRTKTVEIPPYVEDEETGTKHRVKDLNELLFYGGRSAVMDAIINAKQAEIASVMDLSDVRDINIADIDGVYFGFNELDRELFKLFYGTLTLVTGKPGCVSCDTEFFDGKGWKRIDQYQPGDKVLQYNEDGTTTLVEPIQYHKYPCDHFWKIETKRSGVSQVVSDEHNLLYVDHKNRLHGINTLELLEQHNCTTYGFNGRFISGFRYSGQGINLTDEQIRVMCAVICEGSFFPERKDPSRNLRVRLNLKKKRKQERLRVILKDAGIEWQEHNWNPKDPEYINFIFQAPLRTKVFDEYWYGCTQEQLQIIVDEVFNWDGSISSKGVRSFSTTIGQTADFIQFAFSACGMHAGVTLRDRTGQLHKDGKYIRKSKEYEIIISNCIYHGISGRGEDKPKTQIVKVPSEDGFKYCFTVPSGMLVLRHNRVINLSKNSGKSSVLFQVVCNALEQRKNVWVYSKELPAFMQKSWMNFLLAGPRNIEPCEGRNGATYYRLKRGVSPYIDEAYRGQWFVYKDEFSNDVEAIEDSMEASVRRYGTKLFLVDNLMMVNLHASDENRFDKQTDFVSWLIQFAAKYQVAVILVAHPRKTQTTGAIDLYDVSGSSNLVNLAHRTLSIRRVSKEEQAAGGDFAKYSCVVSVTKDRMRGRSGFELGLYYDDASRRFYSNYEEYDRVYRWDANSYNDRLPCPVLDLENEVYGAEIPYA